MDQRLSDVQQELVRSADQMLERHAPLDRIDAVAATEHGYDRDLLARTAMLGWTGLGLERAGEESTLVELGLVVSRMGYFAVASPLRATMSAGLLAARLPEATQACDDLLARIAGEAAPVCVLDARDLDGDGTIGQVEWAAAADAFLLVTAEDADRIAVRLLPRHHAAVSVTPLEVFDNERVADVRLTALDPAGLPLIGGASRAVWGEQTQLTRLLRAADLLGCARRAMDMTVDNAKRRHQFGRPIGMFQAVQHHSADMRMDVESASLLVWSALWRAAHAHPFTRHALMAAWHTGEAAERVTKTAVQLHGGIGFMKEYPLHHFYRRAKAHKLRLGTPRHLLAELGDAVLADAERDFHGEFAAWPAA
ncbi:alkylation response protein AidB-like acyl-CoA dehydrogenase [Thermocatellispora tengchongensis]|uniref:Alkylation response protein AidB-like acyl-CoA dehydrogenase n=1 Tax=Thermocatellispora tengchongensis TaxID=1073253 RepID=A0A840P663_9ACTN|nr:acyl-CoA dehydrogenase [Thermocatellispora tengchongensis]MBB5136824.1 alkylation response protein AidB-like acyl-CoA dehydrogenase [Thermocatellispora tengchongensis]